MNRTRIITAAALTLVAVGWGGLLFAGPINPPAGPVTSTYKTLTEVEPRIAINATNTPGDADSRFKITQPGSYYLTGNITGVAGRHGIEIAASGVTLDLMGFDLVGIPGMGAFDGVSATVIINNVTIRNGSVRNWGDEGVDLGTSAPINSAVMDVRASGNTGNGISIGNGGTITGCSAYQNTVSGISIGSGSTITGCAASNNTGNGIVVGPGSTLTGCTAYLNTGGGISTSTGCTITGCTAYFNTGNGIETSTGSTISNCTARSNTLDGIRVSSDCLILANTCYFNGNGDGAGIHATGSDNRIEGNNCVDADRGIDVDTAGNIIIRNTCSGNTINWTIAANNVVGPILDRTAPASAAISGNSAPDSTGSTHPNANFSY